MGYDITYMKGLLLNDVKTLGKKGEIKEVSEGYARNFLVRQGFAEIATSQTLTMLDARDKRIAKLKAQEEKEGRKVFTTLNGKNLVVWDKVSGGTTLYSAISPSQIADRIEQEFKLEVDIKDIIIDEPLKRVGDYTVMVKCNSNLKAQLNVKVESID